MKSSGPLIDIIKSQRLFWIICGGLLLVNLLFYLFFITTQSRQIAQLQARFQTERKRVSEMRLRQAARDQFQTLRASWEAFEAGLPGKTQSPERIQRLKQILNQYQLDTADLSFRSETLPEERLVRFTTAFQTSGSYEALKRFIGDLQSLQGLFCVHNLDLQQKESGTPIDMTMELSAYFSEQNEP
jgi:Tfp pilus assembly protein PilO